jgi:hypothetical protein
MPFALLPLMFRPLLLILHLFSELLPHLLS